jgi:cysteine synthase
MKRVNEASTRPRTAARFLHRFRHNLGYCVGLPAILCSAVGGVYHGATVRPLCEITNRAIDFIGNIWRTSTVTNDHQRRIRDLAPLIGNTPLLALEFKFRGEKRTLYAKAENLNMTGSIKDRMAFHILQEGYARGVLKSGDLIAEATSGNTGIAFCAIGRALGHSAIIFMPDWMSAERINLIKSLGAQIVLISKEEGGFLGSIRRSEELAASRRDVFLPKQFSNKDNIEAHYRTTGPEIWWQLRWHGLYPDAFIAGVGTGGTIMGVGKYLKERHASVKLHPLEPSNSPTMSTGHKVGKHRIQGISDEFIPPIVDLSCLDEVIAVDDGDSIIMAQKLAAELGLGVGISSGANFIGALQVQNDLGKDAVVVTVFSDDNKKYLSTDLLRQEPANKGFLAPEVELLNVTAFKRVCQTCCDPDLCMESFVPFPENEMALPPCPKRAAR